MYQLSLDKGTSQASEKIKGSIFSLNLKKNQAGRQSSKALESLDGLRGQRQGSGHWDKLGEATQMEHIGMGKHVTQTGKVTGRQG